MGCYSTGAINDWWEIFGYHLIDKIFERLWSNKLMLKSPIMSVLTRGSSEEIKGSSATKKFSTPSWNVHHAYRLK